MIIALAVDGLLLAAINMESINCMKLELAKTFEMDEVGDACLYLGLETERHRAEWKLWPTQSQSASLLMLRFGMDRSCSLDTPMEGYKMFELKCFSSAVLSINYPVYSFPTREEIRNFMYLIFET